MFTNNVYCMAQGQQQSLSQAMAVLTLRVHEGLSCWLLVPCQLPQCCHNI